MALILGALFLPPWLRFISARRTERGLNVWARLNGKKGGERPLLSPPRTVPFMASLQARYDELAAFSRKLLGYYSSLRQPCCPGVLYARFWLTILAH